MITLLLAYTFQQLAQLQCRMKTLQPLHKGVFKQHRKPVRAFLKCTMQQHAQPCTASPQASREAAEAASCASRHLTPHQPRGEQHLLIQANQPHTSAVTTGMHPQSFQMFFQLPNIMPYTFKTELLNLSQDSVQPLRV